MTGHATPGDLCTDTCTHLCPPCENSYGEVCEDLFEHPIAGVIACQNEDPFSWDSPTWGQPGHNAHDATTDDLGHGRHSEGADDQ